MQIPVDPSCSSGISRRSFFRFAAGASALASLPNLTEAHFALAAQVKFGPSNKGIHIDANENPLGPCEAARKAIEDMIPKGGRYKMDLEEDVTATFAAIEGLNPESVMAFAGSSGPLHYTVLSFTDAQRPLVIADPGYEAPIWAAKVSGAPVIKVPLADPQGGGYPRHQGHVGCHALPGSYLHLQPQ
jgi:histidinol-phosphate aminotransferase